MIPYSYNMVDMGGIDLAEANGTVVPGVYGKIVEAMNLCGDLILYNWKFAGIDIAPSAYTVLQQTSSILINGLIQVTELNQITVIGLPPPLVPVSPLSVVENGLYEAEPPASGFNPVSVIVPERIPIIEPLSITENGTYPVPQGIDGFGPITAQVPGAPSKEFLYEFTEAQGNVWINTNVSVSDIQTLIFDDVRQNSLFRSVLFDVSNIAVYTGGADVYTTIYIQTKAMNARIYNGLLYVSYNGSGTAAYATKIYKYVL